MRSVEGAADEGGMLGDEDRRIGDVLDLRLEGEREHPEENQDRRRDDHENREGERHAARDALRAAPDPPRLRSCSSHGDHLLLWRT